MATTQHLVPNANSPQLLTRLLEMVARGIRSTRGLQEALSVDPRTVQYYVRAAEWLGMVEAAGDCVLTPLGLEYVYAGRRRSQVYAAAVRANPLAAELLAASGSDRLPTLDEVQRALAAGEPDLAPATLRRRASAVRGLIAPAVGRRGRHRPRDEEHRQLDLPLTMVPSKTRLPELRGMGPREHDPDVYRYVYAALLDHGELSLGQLRALLDRAGADAVPIGGYVDLALARGDARRVGERLVTTAEGARRRELADSTGSIILSDAGYRRYLDDARAAAADRAAEIRRDQAAARYRAWDRRLFGHPLRPDTWSRDLERVLLDRPLETFPVAIPGAAGLQAVEEPFLDAADRPGVALCLPPYLAQLQGGVAAVNRMLKSARQGRDVGVPDLGHRPTLYHGGIIHPGEPLPRSVPDTRSLRLRVLMHAPYPALAVALLLLHRQRHDLAVVRDAGGIAVRVGRVRLGDLLKMCDAFAAALGHVVCRRSEGFGSDALVHVLEALGLGVVVGGRVVLDERFFVQLRVEAEELEVYERLLPLAQAWEAWLDAAGPT